MLWHYLPLAGMVAIILITTCVRPWLQYRRHGTGGILLFQSGRPAQNARDAALVALIALLVAQAAGAAFGRHGHPMSRAPLGLEIAGAALLLGGVGLLAAAQLNMGASWRVGIKDGEAPGLVTGGLYRFCRHPIYLGLLTALVGYTLLLPTPFSLVLLVAAHAGVRMQAAAEEAYLMRTYGGAYRAYARRVGRFVPGIGQL